MKNKKIKQFMALVFSIVMVFSIVNVDVLVAKRLPGVADLGRIAAAEGVVLLENPDLPSTYDEVNSTGKMLPINNGETISVFGRTQMNYFKTGNGSGGAVTTDYTVGILEGLRNNPSIKINEDLVKVYSDFVKDNPYVSGGWGTWPLTQKEMLLTDAVVADAKSKSDAAIVIIGRIAGEDQDNRNTEGAYLLNSTEKTMLQKVSATFDRVIVVLNVGNIIDMSWVSEYCPDAAIVYGWQGGMEGGNGLADILTGDVTPSGKLTDTIAINISDYPSDGQYDGKTLYGSNSANYYAEDIYVGYRYFETFAKDRVLYPFGFGLSYTSFDIETDNVAILDNEEIAVTVTVTNTGDVRGKEIVQIYYGAPQGALGKAAKELAGFAKTGIIKPGASQELTVKFKINDMASYDDSNATGNKSSYVLEAGDYKIYVGNSVTDSALKHTYNIGELKVVEVLEQVMPVVDDFKRMKPDEFDEARGVYSDKSESVPLVAVATAQAELDARIAERRLDPIKQVAEKTNKLIDVYDEKITMDEYLAQLTNSDLASIVLGEGMSSPKAVTQGTAGIFGGVTDSLLNLGLPIACAADGPSGIRIESGTQDYKSATSLPNGTMLACTWNLELVEKLSELWGEELLLNKVDTVLGPGVNIHRHPLNGRNFEYFSEDPLVTGVMAAAITRGVQSKGPTTTIKHFTANNQEAGRTYVNSIVSERALREIYLKGYEIAVKSANASSIMTSYNPVNGIWSASNYDLNTTVLRGEWGFDGIVMTDWWANMNNTINSGSSNANTQYMVRAQNDLYMVEGNYAAGNSGRYTINLNAINANSTALSDFQRSARNILNTLMKSPAFARTAGIPYVVDYDRGEDWFKVETDVVSGDPKLTGIKVGGKSIFTFSPLKLDYKVYFDPEESTGYPEITATGEDQVEISIVQATAMRPAATIIASKGSDERIYKVIFSSEEGLPPIFENPEYAYLQSISVNGKPMSDFLQTKYNYTMGLSDLSQAPVVEATPIDGARIISNTWDPDTKSATIKCASADQRNTYVIRFGSRPQSDDFNYTGELKEFWTATNQNSSLSLTGDALRVVGEKGDFYQDHNDLKNFVNQEAFGDWVATTKIDLSKTPNQKYNGVGIAAYDDMDNYVWLAYEYNENDYGTFPLAAQGVVTLTREDNAANPMVFGAISSEQVQKILDGQTTIYMRMKKVGDVYTGYISGDGSEFFLIGSTSVEYSTPKLGLSCSNGSVSGLSGFSANFDYINFEDIDQGALPELKIDEDTKLKLTEFEPALMSSSLTTTATKDIDGGRYYSDSSDGAYIVYDAQVLEENDYYISARIKSDALEVAQMSFSLFDGEQLIGKFSPKTTYGNWITIMLPESVKLSAGTRQLKIVFDTSGIDLSWIKFQVKEDLDLTELLAVIEEAEGLLGGKYPEQRLKEFMIALNSAKDIAENAIRQSTVNEAKADLEEAIVKLLREIPSNIPPKNTTERFVDDKKVVRVMIYDTPWIWAQDIADFRIESANSNAGYITTKDLFYFGKMDLTGLEEIRINYATGTNTTAEYQPSVDFRFYTEAVLDGEFAKRSTTQGSPIYHDAYSGGVFAYKNLFARINFLHKNNAGWANYGDATTNGSTGSAIGSSSSFMNNYWEDTNQTYLDQSLVSDMQNVYLELNEGVANIKYVDFVYDLVDVSFDLNYSDAPTPPESVRLAKGEVLDENYPVPQRDGFVFTGWTTEASGGSEIKSDTPITSTIKLYAQWSGLNNFEIMFDDGDIVANATVFNETDSNTKTMLIVAVYDNAGRLVKSISVLEEVVAGETKLLSASISDSEIQDMDAKYAKAFLCDGSTMAPLLPAETCSLIN